MAKTKKPDGGELRIEYVALADLRKWPRNPKRHDEPGIRASILRFGFVAPIAVDEGTGRIVAGHGRLEALLELEEEARAGALEHAVPKNIRAVGGRWHVPVVRGASFANEDEAEAFLVADNRLSEIGGWDETLLKDVLKNARAKLGEDAVVTGYSRSDLDAMLDAARPTAPPGSATQAPSLTLHFSAEAKRDAVKARILEAAGKSKDPTGDVLARVLGIGRAKRR